MNRNEKLNKIGIAYGADPEMCNRGCELDAIIQKLSNGTVTPEYTFNGKLRQILSLIV